MNKLDKVCIIAVGYNRPDAIKRLLKSLSCAIYNEEVDLLVSIDKGQRQSEIKELAENFVWPFGDKYVRAFPERQGLRNHILQCGDMTNEYKAVVVLEDDITVAEGFYEYVRQCLAYCQDNDAVSGISLYKNSILQTSFYFFEPAFDGHDVFLMQYAQSWGQCWTKRMWSGFKAWYLENVETYFQPENANLVKIPNNVIEWDSHSWLKYYIAYTVEANKFFVYPYHSLSTNHSECGQHFSAANSDYMISTQKGLMQYRFPDFDQAIRYDVFFERMNMIIPGYENKVVVFDLYGNKKDFSGADILISSAPHPYKVLDTWQLKYRPQEDCCIHQEPGQGIYVYDLKITETPPPAFADNIRTRYDAKNLSWKRLIQLGMSGFKKALKSKLKR